MTKQIIVDCGGTVDDYDNNRVNSAYQSCYKRKGFGSSLNYWSSRSVKGDENLAWIVGFDYNNGVYGRKYFSFYVRCVRDGQ